jgi:hypothetical protein
MISWRAGTCWRLGLLADRRPSDGAAVFVAHLVEVGVDAAVLGAVLEVGLQERAVGLVQLTGLQDHLGHGVLVRVQKALGKARRASGGLGVLHAQAVKGCGDGLGSPDVHLHACLALQECQDFGLLLTHVTHVRFALGAVKVDALERDVHQHRQHLCLEVKDGLDLVAGQQGLEVVPELKRERGVLLSVIAHVHGRQLPQLLLGVHTKVRRGLFQAPAQT